MVALLQQEEDEGLSEGTLGDEGVLAAGEGDTEVGVDGDIPMEGVGEGGDGASIAGDGEIGGGPALDGIS